MVSGPSFKIQQKGIGETGARGTPGKESNTAIEEFGERILYMPKLISKQQSRFSSGIFLGLQRRSNEAIIGTENGVFKCRTIRRMAPDQKWSMDFIKKIVGTLRTSARQTRGEHHNGNRD